MLGKRCEEIWFSGIGIDDVGRSVDFRQGCGQIGGADFGGHRIFLDGDYVHATVSEGVGVHADSSGRIDHAANTGYCQHARSTQSNLWPAGLLEADGGGHPQAVRVNEALVRSSEEQLLLGDQSRAQAGVEIGVLTAKCAHGGERVERWQEQGRCEEGLALGEGLAGQLDQSRDSLVVLHEVILTADALGTRIDRVLTHA